MTVFFFTQLDHSNYFKSLLTKENISYEFEVDKESDKFYFGISNSELKRVKKLNFLVFAKYRKPFIQSWFIKFMLLGITALFIILAIIGYVLS